MNNGTQEHPFLGFYKFIFTLYIKFHFLGFIERGYNIQGAIILDTLLNWDDREDSQEVSPFWQHQVPWVNFTLISSSHVTHSSYLMQPE